MVSLYRALIPILHITLSIGIILCCCNLSIAANNASTITIGSSLSGSKTIQSDNGLFQFGFFAIPAGSSSKYLGVSYTNTVETFTTAWVANRESAVTESAVCTFSKDGLVSLTDKGKTVWEIGGNRTNAYSLTILDSGNLVLEDSNSTVIWQSFDHPGDTWLPSMTLGPTKKLTSWLTENDPRPGPYSLIMGNNSNFVVIYNDSKGSIQYWDSGAWTGASFSNVPEMTNNFIFDFSFSNITGFNWYVYPNQSANYNISRFVMQYDGLISESSYVPGQQNWNIYWTKPNNPCDVIRLCGENSICYNDVQPHCTCPSTGFKPVDQQEWSNKIYNQGCARSSSLYCTQAASTDGFLAINTTTFANWTTTALFSTEDVAYCESLCQSNCSCKGFYFKFGNCSHFSGDLYDGTVVDSSTEPGTYYLRVSATDLPTASSGSGKTKIKAGTVAGAVVGAAAGLAIATFLIFSFVKRKRRMNASKRPEGGLRAFTYAELQGATKNFKEKIGGGGFGTVYKGTVSDVSGGYGGDGDGSLAVAVKKLHRLDEGEKQFRAEVRTIGTIQHVNLVRLLGFCSEGRHRLLVYELADHGSLDSVLFHDHQSPHALNWPTRQQIALSTARGIAYLHESCRECIIHCDIKPENILLTSPSYLVKVADFGLSKLVGREFSHVLTTLRGTRGYLAPEWIAGMPITAKADVYSFGMTILELISGQRNIQESQSDASHEMFFPVWAARLVHQADVDLTCLVDPRLEGKIDMEELKRMLYVAIWCIQDNEDARPSMGKVVQILEGSINVELPPIPMSLQCLIGSDSFVEPPSFIYSKT